MLPGSLRAIEPHPVVIRPWTPTATVSWSKWGQMEVAATPKRQRLPTILSSDAFAPLLSHSFLVFLNFQKICIWEDIMDRV